MSLQGERDFAVRVPIHMLYDKPYHDPRMFHEYAIALDLLKRHTLSGKVLDLGCGPGWTSLFLERAGYEVVGVDVAPRMIDVARDRARTEAARAEFFVADVEELDLRRSDFDAVLFFDSLHHCPNFAKALERSFAHLKPGGSVVMLETTLLHRYSSHAKEAVHAYDVTELGFTRRQLSRALRSAGFGNVQFHRDPGQTYRGAFGLLKAFFRLCCDFAFYYPQAKNIVTAVKPGAANESAVRQAA